MNRRLRSAGRPDLESVVHEPGHLDHVAPGSIFAGELFMLSDGQRALSAFRSTVRGALVIEVLVLAVLGRFLGLVAGGLIAVSGVYAYAQTVVAFRFGLDLPVGFFAATILVTVVIGGLTLVAATRGAVKVPPRGDHQWVIESAPRVGSRGGSWRMVTSGCC